jgi:glyoxylase-like metal-dependent hydrolase (beta-lactamase superfamily II)
MKEQAAIPLLEDELGDVLEKALRRAGLSLEKLSQAAGVEEARIRDAIDYRPDFSAEELQRLAAVLNLNEVGLCALGAGRYPLPEIAGLPFSVWPLRMPHGIGVANAYLVAEDQAGAGLLFDTGPGIAELETGWPANIDRAEAVFLTHAETEHSGGLCEMLARVRSPVAYVPRGVRIACARPAGEGEVFTFGSIEVSVLSTPGHASAHNCYWVRVPGVRSSRSLLISGDLVFAGSAGGGYFCQQQLQCQLRRVFDGLPPSTIIAPGHGPMTTVENELRFNPFLL